VLAPDARTTEGGTTGITPYMTEDGREYFVMFAGIRAFRDLKTDSEMVAANRDARREPLDRAQQVLAADVLASVRDAIAVAEKQHAKRYEKFRHNIESGKVFKADKPVVWRCINCGYLFEGAEAPKACPACAHPQAYFELLGENF